MLVLRDHFSAGAFGQQLAPFTGLAAAAAVTTRLRLGTIVLSNDFRHPAIVAHEAASLHVASFGTFIITDRRRAETEDLITRRGWTGIRVVDVWHMPTIFIGSPDQIRSDLAERRDRFGLSYLVAAEESLPALAEVASGL